MFRLNEEYVNGMGSTVRIICVDSKIRFGGNPNLPCPIVGEVTQAGALYPATVVFYDVEGRYCGLKTLEYAKHNLISNDPTEEELSLIRDIGDYCERKDDDSEERLLKIIRALRKK